MKLIISAIIISGLIFTGCKDTGYSTENISYDSSLGTVNIQRIDSNTLKAPVSPVQNTLQNQPTPQITTTTAPGMNPPHGQPGHRCDIAVGAPLNSPVSKTVTTPTTQPVTLNTTNVTAVKTAPGMNPPHGQPGHRCDIAVGAALNSAPSKPVSVNTTTKSNPAESVPVKAASDTAVKL